MPTSLGGGISFAYQQASAQYQVVAVYRNGILPTFCVSTNLTGLLDHLVDVKDVQCHKYLAKQANIYTIW
jgi:hypothetical protein